MQSIDFCCGEWLCEPRGGGGGLPWPPAPGSGGGGDGSGGDQAGMIPAIPLLLPAMKARQNHAIGFGIYHLNLLDQLCWFRSFSGRVSEGGLRTNQKYISNQIHQYPAMGVQVRKSGEIF